MVSGDQLAEELHDEHANWHEAVFEPIAQYVCVSTLQNYHSQPKKKHAGCNRKLPCFTDNTFSDT